MKENREEFVAFKDKYEPVLDKLLVDKKWWDETMSEAKRSSILFMLRVGSLAAIGGAFVWLKANWARFFGV